MDNIRLSYSSIALFLKCRHAWYLRYIKGYEKIKVHIPFIMGDCIHYGLHKIYLKEDNYVEDTLKYLEERKQELRDNLVMSTHLEEELIKAQYIIEGMLVGYVEKHGEFINETTHIVNEKEDLYEVAPGIKILVKLDNILENEGKKYNHEIKTTTRLTVEYVNAIMTDLQTGIYYSVYNEIYKPLDGIIYDVLKKPTIRVKQNETVTEYLQRLIQWYKETEGVFHMEKIKYPILKKGEIFNLIKVVANDILRCIDIDNEFYKNYTSCYGKGFKCDMYDICHIGENASTMAIIKVNLKKKEEILNGKI